ncbi:MAG: VOC family protein [Candidatus Bathyarchaeota archaeon]|nr:VOC family protein [Candidatus Bathyarchaeota archaeon]
MIKKIAYVGIAVKNIEQARENFTQKLGSKIIRVGASEIDHVKNTYLTVGEDVFELMEPYSPESPVARFMEKRGEGVQYIGLEVTDLDDMMTQLREKGVRFTSEKPVEYPNGSRWAFIHPKEMHGVLFALIENPA